MCCLRNIIGSSNDYQPVFDQITDLSNECKIFARNKSIQCEYDACEDVGCPYCRCDEEPSIENLCKINWQSMCCYSKVIYSLCSDKDKVVADEFKQNFTQELESTTCKDHPSVSYKCNNSISEDYNPVFDRITDLSQECKTVARNNACENVGCPGCKCEGE